MRLRVLGPHSEALASSYGELGDAIFQLVKHGAADAAHPAATTVSFQTTALSRRISDCSHNVALPFATACPFGARHGVCAMVHTYSLPLRKHVCTREVPRSLRCACFLLFPLSSRRLRQPLRCGLREHVPSLTVRTCERCCAANVLEHYVGVWTALPTASSGVARNFELAKKNLAWVCDALCWPQFDNTTPVSCGPGLRALPLDRTSARGWVLAVEACNREWKPVRASAEASRTCVNSGTYTYHTCVCACSTWQSS